MYARVAITAMKIEYCNPQLVETTRMASRNVNPTVVGFTWITLKKTQTMIKSIATTAAKRKIGCAGLLTGEIVVYSTICPALDENIRDDQNP